MIVHLRFPAIGSGFVLVKSVRRQGSGSTPRGGKAVYQREGVPFLRSQNAHNDGLHLDDVAYITAETHKKMSGTALQPGDLLLNITGGSIGRSCIVPGHQDRQLNNGRRWPLGFAVCGYLSTVAKRPRSISKGRRLLTRTALSCFSGCAISSYTRSSH